MSDTESNTGSEANLNQGGQQSSNVNSADETLQDTLVKLNTRLDALEAHQKTQQSGKDRGINRVQKEQQEIRSEFAEVKQYLDQYGNIADAERNYNIDQFLANAQNPQVQAAEQGSEEVGEASQQNAASNETTEFLTKLGVDQTSPEYLAQLGKGLTPEQAALAYLASDVSGAPEGSASGVSGGQGGGTVQTSQEVLRTQYTQELDAIQLQNGWIAPAVMYQVKEKYAKLGLQGLDY
jgi:hypothetical protein